MKETTKATLTRIEPYSPTEILLTWKLGEHPQDHTQNQDSKYAVPNVEMRYYCPCAHCIDEHTGERTIQKTSISPDIRATDVRTVGRYAIQVTWSDGHDTGIYSFDRLYELSEKLARKL